MSEKEKKQDKEAIESEGMVEGENGKVRFLMDTLSKGKEKENGEKTDNPN